MWTPAQIRTAAIAARHAGWNDQQRKMVLSSLGGRAVHGGQLTSRSPRLNQDDFEQFMATAEADAAPGNDGRLPGFSPGYWRDKVGDAIQRQRHTILQLVSELNLPAAQFRGMIHRATGGRASSIEDLDQLNDRAVAGKVIDLLKDKRRAAKRVADAPDPAQYPKVPTEAIPI